MSWSTAPSVFARKYEARQREIFYRVVKLVFESIVEGSTISGAPSMPVDTGNARAGWSVKYLSATEALISTGVLYAIYIEDNPRGVTFRNGGPHGVKMTRVAFQRIVEQATREVLAEAA